MSHRLAPILLGLLLALLTLSHWSPQAAWPIQATTTALGAIIVLAGAGVLCLRPEASRPFGVSEAGASAFVVAWAAWWILRMRGAPVPAMARLDVGVVVQGAIVFLAATTLLSLQQRQGGSVPAKPVLAWLASIGAVYGALAIAQVHGPAWLPGTFRAQEANLLANRDLFSPNMLDGLLHAVREGRASARLGSPNVFAGLMAVAFPATLALAASAGTRGRTVLWSLAGVLEVAGVVLSGSRGGLAATLLGGLLFAAAALRVRMTARMATVALLAFLALGAADPAASSRRWLGLSTLQQRALYWEAGWSIWMESPLVGRGPGAFEIFYPAHRVAGSQETKYAHNWVVQWGSETGWIGIALFALLAGLAIAPALRVALGKARTRDEKLLAAGAAAAACAAIAHGLVEFTLQSAEIHLDVALLLACCASFSVPSPARRLPRWPLALAVAIAALPAWNSFVRKPAAAEWERTLAEDAWTGGEPAIALDHVERAMHLQVDRPDLYAMRAALSPLRGQATDADMRMACSLNPWSAQFIENLAASQWARGNEDYAIELQRRAHATHPLDAMHRLRLADYLHRKGRIDEARQLVASVADLKRDFEETREMERLRQLLGSE